MPTPMPLADSPQFAEPVRGALIEARHEAVRLRHPYVGTEHLLLALLRLSHPDAQRLWAVHAVESEALARAVERALRAGDERHAIADPNALPYTSTAKTAIERMLKEAAAAGQLVAQPEHLLLGLVSNERAPAAMFCKEAGLEVERVRAVARELSAARGRMHLIELDDRSDVSISDQIVRQIQERVATGAVASGHQLPPVRRLADLLDIAPGTVARAYAELERLGVVVTEGARGTRVAERRAPPDSDAPPPEGLLHLLRPVVIAAYHMGASAQHLRTTLEATMTDIFDDGSTTLV